MLGSWEINVAVESMPQKIASAMGKLQEQLIGAEYKPIAYLGSQLVNGVNHAVLAEQTILSGKDTKNVVVLIFNEKGMECTLVNIERVVEGGDGMGAVEVNVKTDIPADALAAYAKVMDGFAGSDVKPFALLATQVVAGIDYIFAAEMKLVTAEPVSKVVKVTVNSLRDTVQFVDILK
jgi:hypothetical protein